MSVTNGWYTLSGEGGGRNDDTQNFGLEFLSFGILMIVILLAV